MDAIGAPGPPRTGNRPGPDAPPMPRLMSELLADMAAATGMHRPGPYWREHLRPGLDHLAATGWLDVKGIPGMRSRYVDGGEPERDYAVFRFCDRPDRGLPLSGFSETRTAAGDPQRYVHFDGGTYTKASLKYLRAMAWVASHLPAGHRFERVVEIGGGYGVLGEMTLGGSTQARYVNVDIPLGAFASTRYLQGIFGAAQVWGLEQTGGLTRLDPRAARGLVLTPRQFALLDPATRFDVAVVFKAFQGMPAEVSRHYAQALSRFAPPYVVIMNRKSGGNPRPGRHPMPSDSTPLRAALDSFADYRTAAFLDPPFSDGDQRLVLLERRP